MSYRIVPHQEMGWDPTENFWLRYFLMIRHIQVALVHVQVQTQCCQAL